MLTCMRTRMRTSMRMCMRTDAHVHARMRICARGHTNAHVNVQEHSPAHFRAVRIRLAARMHSCSCYSACHSVSAKGPLGMGVHAEPQERVDERADRPCSTFYLSP